MNKTLEHIWAKKSKRISWYFENLGREKLIDELAAERLVAIGFRNDEVQLIPYDFWITRWRAYFKDNNAWNAKASYREIKCCPKSDIDPSEYQSTPKPRPTEAQELRWEAISRCDDLERVDLSGGVKSKRSSQNNIDVRTEIYVNYLCDEYPDRTFIRDDGEYADRFCVKSFERTETKYKKNKRQNLSRT